MVRKLFSLTLADIPPMAIYDYRDRDAFKSKILL